ncbi:MAG: AraC family transcriptional regulator, partial [Desulfovibrio sp.]|nr:AraC family transcriptional regulator [Desulfovibrio sp.]
MPYSGSALKDMAFRDFLAYIRAMEAELAAHKAERLAFAQARLRELLLAQMPQAGVFSAKVPDIGMARRDTAGFSEHRFDRPLVSLLAQGSKETTIGGEILRLEAPQLLTVCVDMPSSSRILAASPQEPLLTLYFYLNPALIRELLPALDGGNRLSQSGSGILASQVDPDFMEAMLRLASIMEKEDHVQLRAE